jgi:putative hemolysin
MDPREINTKHVDIQKILANKGVKLPHWAVRMMERLLHADEINSVIYRLRDKFGLDFVHAFLEGDHPEDLNAKILVTNPEHIPAEGYPIVAGNHPLGGPDGLAVMAAVGRYRKDIKFPVNDFLCYLPGLKELFVAIDKVNKTKALANLEQAFADAKMLLYFPAGACSRRIKGVVQDLEWKPTFVKKAVKYGRDIVPVFTDALNRNRFYTVANLRKRLGIKFSYEMAMLPAEMFAQRGKTFSITFGKPIAASTFDRRHTPAEWAALLREHVYKLKTDPAAEFAY